MSEDFHNKMASAKEVWKEIYAENMDDFAEIYPFIKKNKNLKKLIKWAHVNGPSDEALDKKALKLAKKLEGYEPEAAGGNDCEGTTKYLEPYMEDGQWKHFNYSGPGNPSPFCKEYVAEHPPITEVNGKHTNTDLIAFEHDKAYTKADEEKDPKKRQQMLRAADKIFIQEHEKHRNEPGKTGYKVIKAKVAAEDVPVLGDVFRKVSKYAGRR